MWNIISLTHCSCILYLPLITPRSDHTILKFLTDTDHCTLYDCHCKLHTVQFTLQTTPCILHTVHCTTHTVYCKLYTVDCTIHTVYCKLYTVDCTIHTVYSSAHQAAQPLLLAWLAKTHWRGAHRAISTILSTIYSPRTKYNTKYYIQTGQ